jgi:DNA topoisomerase-1
VQKRSFGTKNNANAQEAHECIRPTNIEKENINDTEFTKHHKQLYKAIWTRTICSLMKAATYNVYHIVVPNDNETFCNSVKSLSFPGYLIVSGKQANTEEIVYYDDLITKDKSILNVTCTRLIGVNSLDSNIGRYNEAGLVKDMEEKGIGRPSTYAAIIEKLYDRNYIETKDIKGEEIELMNFECNIISRKIVNKKIKTKVGSEKGKLCITDLGMEVYTFLEKYFHKFIDVGFTSELEHKLDDIVVKSLNYKTVVNDFWEMLSNAIEIYTKDNDDKTIVKKMSTKRNIIVNGIEIKITNTKYGNAIEYNDAQNKKQYINLKKFYEIFDKNEETVTEKDITFLISLPLTVKSEETLHYGRYGFYTRNNKGETKSSNDIQYISALIECFHFIPWDA